MINNIRSEDPLAAVLDTVKEVPKTCPDARCRFQRGPNGAPKGYRQDTPRPRQHHQQRTFPVERDGIDALHMNMDNATFLLHQYDTHRDRTIQDGRLGYTGALGDPVADAPFGEAKRLCRRLCLDMHIPRVFIPRFIKEEVKRNAMVRIGTSRSNTVYSF